MRLINQANFMVNQKKKKIIQVWRVDFVFKLLKFQTDHATAGGDRRIHEGPTTHCKRGRGYAVNILVPNTTAHLQGKYGLVGFVTWQTSQEESFFFLSSWLGERRKERGQF